MTKPTQDKPGRGGKRPGAGRKTKDGAKPTVKVLISIEEAQRAKLRRLGGTVWVRAKIDEAEEPQDKDSGTVGQSGSASAVSDG